MKQNTDEQERKSENESEAKLISKGYKAAPRKRPTSEASIYPDEPTDQSSNKELSNR